MPRTIKTVITALLCLTTTLPAGAAVISYTAATVGLTANIVGTGIHDDASTSSSPTTVTASYNPPGEGAPSGNASTSITTLTQSLNGFHMQGSLFGSSTAGSGSGVEVNGGVNPSRYDFTIADPTWVTLDVNITRNLSGFWGGSGGLRVGICASSGPCPPTGVSGLGTGNQGGQDYTGTSLHETALLSGSYFLEFFILDSAEGGVPSGTSTYSNNFDISLSFTPVPLPGAALLFLSGLGILGPLTARRK